MAKNVTLLGANYSDVPAVDLPQTGGGTATFTDVSDTTATASDVMEGTYFYTSDGERIEGELTSGGGQVIIRDTTDSHGGTIRTITSDEELYIDSLEVTENGTYTAPSGVAYETLNVNVAGSSITVDDELSTTSENPVQNKVITAALNNKANASSVPTKVSDLTNDSGFMTSSDVSSGYVAKESGKGLSSNDYTSTEKTKLSGIASGAEVNQNAFSNIAVGSSTIQADSKTDTLTLTAGSNITLTPNTSSDSVTIAATVPTVPTNVSAFTNDAGYLTSVPSQYVTDTELATELSGYVETESGKGLSTNDYTTAEKTKLSGIAGGAEVNQNAFSTINVVDQGHDIDVDIDAGAKQDTFAISAGSNIVFGYSTANKEMTISSDIPLEDVTSLYTYSTPAKGAIVSMSAYKWGRMIAFSIRGEASYTDGTPVPAGTDFFDMTFTSGYFPVTGGKLWNVNVATLLYGQFSSAGRVRIRPLIGTFPQGNNTEVSGFFVCGDYTDNR